VSHETPAAGFGAWRAPERTSLWTRCTRISTLKKGTAGAFASHLCATPCWQVCASPSAQCTRDGPPSSMPPKKPLSIRSRVPTFSKLKPSRAAGHKTRKEHGQVHRLHVHSSPSDTPASSMTLSASNTSREAPPSSENRLGCMCGLENPVSRWRKGGAIGLRELPFLCSRKPGPSFPAISKGYWHIDTLMGATVVPWMHARCFSILIARSSSGGSPCFAEGLLEEASSISVQATPDSTRLPRRRAAGIDCAGARLGIANVLVIARPGFCRPSRAPDTCTSYPATF
jgi:hypothetical protein